MPSIRDLMRPNVGEIRPYREGKSHPGAVKLSANENPLGPSPKALQAMRELAPQVRLYPDPLCLELTARLAERLGVASENLIIGRGSDEIIHMLGLAFLRPGDEVIYADPPFALYPFTAKLMDCQSVAVPLKRFVHDLPGMAAAISERTRLIFVANPHNPTGTIVPRAQAEAFVHDLPEHVILAWDAAYHEYVTDGDYVDPLRLIEQRPNVIVLRTFSKIYALAGLRVGYGVAGPELIQVLTQVREPFNVSSVAQAAALASLDDPGQVTRGVQVNEEGKGYLYEQFEALGLEYVPTQANFILVNIGIDSVEAFERLAKAGYTVRTGDIWDLNTWIRLTIGTQEQNEGFAKALRECLRESVIGNWSDCHPERSEGSRRGI